jgi:hypothetical protein
MAENADALPGIVFTGRDEHTGRCPVCREGMRAGQRLVYLGSDTELRHEKCAP